MFTHNNNYFVIIMAIVSLGLFSCSGQSVRSDGRVVVDKKMALLVDSANSMAAERNMDIWKLEDNGSRYDVNQLKNYKLVTIYSSPQAVGTRLCKLQKYQFKAFRIARGYTWLPKEESDEGLVSIFSHIVDAASSSVCAQSTLSSYFDTPDNIENNTLVALHSSLTDQIQNGSVRLINKNDFKIESISLFENTGFGSDGYNAIVNTEVPKSSYGVHMRFKDGRFSIVQISLLI